MGVDILVAIDCFLPETRLDILPLLAETYEERKRHSRLSAIGDSMHFSLTRISFDNGNYAFAEELSLMPANPFWAARAARMQGKMEEARRYFRAYVSNAPGNGDIPNLAFFREAREYFSGDELEELLLPLTEKFGGDVPLLIRTFIAKEKGDNAFVENVYKKSKRKLARFRRRKIPDYEDMEASAEHSYERRD